MNKSIFLCCLVLLSILVILGCNSRERELCKKVEPTVLDISDVCYEWFQIQNKGGETNEDVLMGLISQYTTGYDHWGNEYVVKIIRNDDGSMKHFILLSKGGDGVLDVSKPEDYLMIPQEEPLIRGDLNQLGKDIVVIDCVAWTVGTTK